MASAKGGGTTRRSSSSRGSKQSLEPAVSPARWAGVALVIAAIAGAVFLAMISPSDTDQPSQSGVEVAQVESETFGPSPSPDPSPTDADVNVPMPVVAPKIVTPKDGTRTGEYEFDVTVAVPADRTVKRKFLELHIYDNGKHTKTKLKPKPGTEVKVAIRLTPGDNVLTAELRSPTGAGPASDPTTVILDDEIPPLEIVTPQKKLQTYEDKVSVEVASEIGASVSIHNLANDHDVDDEEIGLGGSISKVIPLKLGKNRIVARSVDEAGQKQEDEVVVTRIDGKPRIKLKVPASVKRPGELRVVAEITGSDKKPMKDAEVSFTLSARNQSSLTDSDTTNAKGRAVWKVPIAASSSPADDIEVGVTVYSPSGHKGEASETVKVR